MEKPKESQVQEEPIKIIIEEQSQEPQDELGCLICSILNALGLHRDALKDYKQDRLKSLLGGDDTVIIAIDAKDPYNEEDLTDIFNDVINMISIEKRYDIDDIKKLRENKKSQGGSLKKLLSLLDDEHIHKAFNGMQIFKNGGQVIEFDEAGHRMVPKRIIKEAISGEEVILPDNLDKDMLEGKKLVKTTKGEGRFIDKKFYFTKNLPIEAGGVKKSQEGDEIVKEVNDNVTTPLKEGQIEIRIDGKIYNVWEAKTEEERERGLQGIEHLEDNEGMIFYYDKPQPVEYWMKDTEIPLTIAFFNSDEECISVKRAEPMSEELIPEDNVMFVVELNVNADVKPGDELEFNEDDEYVMSVLDTDGSSQYEMKSGQRIISRKETVVLIRKAKRAYKNKNNPRYDSYCKSLGKYMFKVLDGQDAREPEYVELKKDEEKA